MKNKLAKLMLTLCAGAFTIMALATSASACGLGAYQPKEPKSLREK